MKQNKWIKAAKWASKQKNEILFVWDNEMLMFNKYFKSSDTCMVSVFTKDHLILALLLMGEIDK